MTCPSPGIGQIYSVPRLKIRFQLQVLEITIRRGLVHDRRGIFDRFNDLTDVERLLEVTVETFSQQ